MIIPQQKTSLLFPLETLDHLVEVSSDTAVADLVSWYKRAQEDLSYYSAMVNAELDHYGVAVP